MNKHNPFLTAALILGSMACAWCSSGLNKQDSYPSVEQSSDLLKSTTYTTSSGKIFILTSDQSLGASIAEVSLETKGFEIINERIDLGPIDPVETVFIADLDSNGFDELYLTTRSAGSGSYSHIYGFASNRDRSVTPIYVPAVNTLSKDRQSMFAGYRGHNEFVRDGQNIINTFPVYNKYDSNADPTGGQRTVYYRLIAGEAGWILEPVQSEAVE